MPNVYKTFNWKTDVQQRNITEASSDKKAAAAGILTNFIAYIKTKHL
jgi:hypothetical protein